jgi:threonine/homoserine/homoserine lactone efflux protein
MIPNEVVAFALATLGESINPGPTLAILMWALTHSRRKAWGIVIGVALANIVWAIIAFVLKELASTLPEWTQAVPLLKALAALILIFFATHTLVSAVITIIESYILEAWSEPIEAKDNATWVSSSVAKGFFVHALNPLVYYYYLGAYSGTLASDPALALVFAFVAVGVDFLLYGALASLPIDRFLKGSPMIFVAQRVFALLAGFAMLFLVAHVFAIDRGDQLRGLRNLFMLLGFLAGAIYAAEEFAARYGGTKNKLLWRGVLVWQSAFGAFAIIGTFLSVLVRIDPDSVGIGKSLISEMAICSLVAAVATAALSYARARGEMLDEADIASNVGQSQNLARTRWLNSPKVMFPILIAGLAVLFGFFVFSGFSDQVGP